MKQDTKQQWVSALRSGKYLQGEQRLATTSKYCCLGVLCEILPYVERIHLYDLYNEIGYRGTEEEMVATVTLPQIVFEKEQLNNSSPWIDFPGKDYYGNSVTSRISLVELNDGGFTFNQIADMIERFL